MGLIPARSEASPAKPSQIKTSSKAGRSAVSISGVASQWLWLVLGIVLIGYGLLAFNAGTTLSPATNKVENGEMIALSLKHQASQGVDMTGSQEALEVSPFWVDLMARLSSSTYAFGEDGLQDTTIYYFSMSETGRTVLSTHMMLGLVLMGAGFLQFWPFLRRRYRKAHRVIGVVYVLTAFTSMTLSGIHLVNTGIANTFHTYVFHMGLWLMLVGVVISLSMAGLALIRKDIARHMGWQALGFGFLLTAPLQRFDWLALSMVAGEASFIEMNILVNTMLLIQASLAGYWLFRANRASSPLRSAEPAVLAPPSATLQRLGYGLLGGLALIGLYPALSGASLSELPVFARVVQPQALDWLSSVVHGGSLLVFATAVSVLMLAAWALLIRLRSGTAQAPITAGLVTICAVAVAAMAFYWAYQLGMPSHERSVGGGGFAMLGLVLALFVVRLARAQRQGERGKAVEWLRFLLLAATSPALLMINLWLIDLVGFIPVEYLAINAGYELAIAGALMTPVLWGFLMSVYSEETARYRIS